MTKNAKSWILTTGIIAVILVVLFYKPIKAWLIEKKVLGDGKPDAAPPASSGASAQTPATSSKADYLRELRKGSKGQEVEILQTWLLRDGGNLGTTGKNGDGIDGDFGTKTEAALKKIKSVVVISLKNYQNSQNANGQTPANSNSDIWAQPGNFYNR